MYLTNSESMPGTRWCSSSAFFLKAPQVMDEKIDHLEASQASDLWQKIETDFDVSRLDELAADGVNVHCINSSDFVVGRQTNFNGPVTIINCEKNLLRKGLVPVKNESDDKEEKVVIRDKVLSESASVKIREMALKNTGGKEKFDFEEGCKEKKPVPWLKRTLCRMPNVLWLCFVAIFIGTIVTALLVLLKQESEDSRKMSDAEETELEPCNSSVERKDTNCIYGEYPWGGRKNHGIPPLSSPVPYVVISETGGNICFDFKSCLPKVENFQVEVEEYGNMSCNFLVGGDGHIYEDLGWNLTNSLKGPVSQENLHICLIGNDVDYPTYPQVETAKKLVQFASSNNFLSKNYILMASNVTSQRKLSTYVYNIIKKWPKFREDPFDGDGFLRDGEYQIYTKEDWGGLPPTSAIEMKLPVPYVVISHSVTSLCYEFKFCASLLRGIQKYHQSITYADIAYNFMVDSEGNIYIGRGWTRRNVAGGFINGRNVNINLIGDYSTSVKPTIRQMNAIKYLLKLGVKTGKLADDYSLLAANSTFSTMSPGKNVYEIIKTWSHFDPHPEEHVKEEEP
ncbi:hypothetical protein RUM43_003256 [Polyplax serrata]|uniref:Peptidoglycan recognition protein family domain-containing protein n=1 Tax=Polyplax serrata TaxID=468196 RepID=A0AAN8S6F4_POLSC